MIAAAAMRLPSLSVIGNPAAPAAHSMCDKENVRISSVILEAAAAWLVGCDPVGSARPGLGSPARSASLVTTQRL
jgi:hypothetical protein